MTYKRELANIMQVNNIDTIYTYPILYTVFILWTVLEENLKTSLTSARSSYFIEILYNSDIYYTLWRSYQRVCTDREDSGSKPAV